MKAARTPTRDAPQGRATQGHAPPLGARIARLGVAAALTAAVAGFGALAALDLRLAGLTAVAALAAGLVAMFFGPLRWIHGAALAGGLFGYALLGRGFAYLGYPPLFVGEALLAFTLVALALRGSLARIAGTPLAWAVAATMAIGAAATLPYVGTYGLASLRDAVLWGYALFALAVLGLLRDAPALWRIVHGYGRVLPWWMAAVTLTIAWKLLAPATVPTMPFSDVPVADVKGGDVAVHLTGALAFLLLGLAGSARARRPATRLPPPKPAIWLAWTLWLATWLATLGGRAALLTVVMGAALLQAVRPTLRWWRPVALVGLLVGAFYVLDLDVRVGGDLRLSPAAVATLARSVVEPVGVADFDGTRSWRLRWWDDIVEYTVFGPYFWTGKGYGINLADDDGYQVVDDGSLRSPHNGHLTILARSGVPGLVAWLVLLAGIAVALLRGYRRRTLEGRDDWARLNLWLLVYGAAFLVNGAFDVYLEGPQGGIWFWTLVGVALAALRIQEDEAATAPLVGPAVGPSLGPGDRQPSRRTPDARTPSSAASEPTRTSS